MKVFFYKHQSQCGGYAFLLYADTIYMLPLGSEMVIFFSCVLEVSTHSGPYVVYR